MEESCHAAGNDGSAERSTDQPLQCRAAAGNLYFVAHFLSGSVEVTKLSKFK